MDTLTVMLSGYALLVALQTALWLGQLRTRDAATADVGWAAGLPLLMGWIACHTDGSNGRKAALFIPLALWSIRLSSHLIRRIARSGGEDRRYARLREAWGKKAPLLFFGIYQLQPLIALVLALPFLSAFRNPAVGLSVLEVTALFVWAGAFWGEVAADRQLRRFVERPDSQGRMCQDGLWNYSRHPNFFFEWMMWMAYALFALSSPGGWIGLAAPALMLGLLLKVTGVPPQEEHALKTKGEAFREYQRTTSVFVPMPKRR